MKKIPLRSCIVTKEKLPKKELVRIVRTPEGEVKIDETGKLNGRGACIKKDIAILEKIKKSDVLQKKLECNIEDSVYENTTKYYKLMFQTKKIFFDYLMNKKSTTEFKKELNKICKLKINEYGLEMFKSGTSLEGMNINDILKEIKEFLGDI